MSASSRHRSARPFLAAAAATLLLSGCALAQLGGQQSSGTFAAGIGETRKFGAAAITPLSVVEDSRCPMGVTCIQAGTVRLLLRIADSGGAKELTVGLRSPATVDGMKLQLLEAWPYPRAPGPIAPEAYRFLLSLEPAASP